MSIVAIGDVASAAAEMAAGRRAAASAGGTVQAAAVLVFAALSLARSAAVVSGYHAPMALYAALPQARPALCNPSLLLSVRYCDTHG